MRAITVRDKATGKIVACGPADGMYDPGFNPDLHTKQEEPDYERLIAEHMEDLAAQPKPPTLAEEVAALKAKVAELDNAKDNPKP